MKARILIIDDVVCVRAVLRRSLEHSGHVVMDANSAFEGINIIRRESIDLIITDLMMPNEDGFYVFDQCAQITTIPIFAMTSSTNETFIRQAYLHGFKEVLNKPIDYNLLNRLIKKHVDPNSSRSVKLDMTLPVELYNFIKAEADELHIAIEDLICSRLAREFDKKPSRPKVGIN